jgi:secernin
LGKKIDRKAGEYEPFVQFAAALHPLGSRLACGPVPVPQMAEAYRVMEHLPWCFFWGERWVNERGFVIGNQAVFSKGIVERRAGLIVMGLLRLALEHARNRNEAVDCIASRLEAHGQGGASFGPDVAQVHNSFNIADRHGAVFMEPLDRHWVVREVELDSVSNHICTGTGWDKCSSGLESFARSEGY